MTTYVLDASVAISALRASDANHARAASHLAPFLQGADAIVVPAIFDVEVIASLVRAGWSPADARRAANLFAAARAITIGPRAARAASTTAAKTHLRTGDALYVWVAERESLPLITFDAEILARAHRAGVTAVAP